MNLSEMKAKDAMIPLKDVFMMSMEDKLTKTNFELVSMAVQLFTAITYD
jgi:CBS domain containing-hemolysin-like protein